SGQFGSFPPMVRLHKILHTLSYSYDDWNARAFDAYHAKQYEDAALYWKHASSIPNAGAVNSAQALFNRTLTLHQLKRHAEACTTYQQLIDTYASNNTPVIRELVAESMLNMGALLGEMQKQDEAIATFEKLIATYSSDNTPAIREQVAKAMRNMGVAFGKMQKPTEAISTYQQLIDTYSSDTTPAIREQVAKALNGKGFDLLLKAKKTWQNREQAQSLLREARNDLLAGLERRPGCGMTRGNLAYVQWLLGEAQAAEDSFRSALAAAQNGGEKLYHGTVTDIEQHTIAEDGGFRAMIERQWAEHQAVKSSRD
ncbi:tetratricopeptide repeat protein, partial [Vogesella fluminis]